MTASMLLLFSFCFPGDTLFIGGCGKFFEGTPEQMYRALCEVLGSLPEDTVRNLWNGISLTLSSLSPSLHPPSLSLHLSPTPTLLLSIGLYYYTS